MTSDDCQVCREQDAYQIRVRDFTKSQAENARQLTALQKLGSPINPGETHPGIIVQQRSEATARASEIARLEALLVPPTPPMISSFREIALLLHFNHVIEELRASVADVETIIDAAGNAGIQERLTPAEVAAAIRARKSSAN